MWGRRYTEVRARERGGHGVRTLHRPGTEGVGVGAGRSASPEPQLYRYGAHLAGPHPRGRRCGRQGSGVSRNLAGGRAREGRRDDRHGRHRTERVAAVHPARQEGPRALVPRGPAVGPQLHRNRAHAARSRPRGRRCGRHRPRQPRCRPRPGAPASHSAHVGQPGQGVGRREPGRHIGRQPLRFAGARPVRSQPDAAGARRQARPGHRPGQGDRAGHAGALAADEEQPRPDR